MLALLLMLAGQEAPRVKPLNREEWITEDDYPASAVRAEAEGTVAFDLTVAGDGHVADCQVSLSSGNADLDSTTCTLLIQRARFSTPQAGLHYRGRILWKIPAPDPEPIAWGHSAGILHLSADNKILSCEDKFEGSATEALGEPCGMFGSDLPREFEQMIGTTGKPRDVTMELTTYFEGEPMPARHFARPGQIPIARLLVRFDIDINGRVANCRKEQTGLEGVLARAPSPCTWHLGPFVPALDKAGKPRATSGALELAISQTP
jgi:TonB family protein